MTGVVIMENGLRNGLPTNHDRDRERDHSQLTNGSSRDTRNMMNGDAAVGHSEQSPSGPGASRMNDLPDEIKHVTQGFIPLGVLVSRLAQRTHNDLEERIAALARIPVPGAPPAVNGNAAHSGSLPDDVSPENLTKKTQLLNFIQETHARWVKALVIAAWSRKVEPVSKLIDLMFHMTEQRGLYDANLEYMMNIKRDLTFARLPNPDLKTALQVLSTGDAPWMPDLNYIEPPRLTPKEQLQWIQNLNTLLSLRLNLDEYDKIPYHFQDYSIGAGRVTFKVPGEFEVDLTIADEDFEKQFWFVDFRFLFEPAPEDLSPGLRLYLENRVNELLGTEGLQGCYNFLHEFILTHKITEYVRQAVELSRNQWVDTLKIERLNRAMAIQYWLGRYPAEGPKSWIILGVHSGRTPGVPPEPSATSRLSLRWFRDNKEVKDVAISFDDATVSTEGLLKKVIGKHIEYILSTIHSKLEVKGRFVKRESSLSLTISEDDPMETSLKMQLGHNDHVTVRIAPTTGFIAMTPQTNVIFGGERKLNWQAKNPAEEGPNCLEQIRCRYVLDTMNHSGKSFGWVGCKGPVKTEEVKPILNTREGFQSMWFRRRGWSKQWYLMMSLSLGGDRWWLIEVNHEQGRITSFTQLPLSPGAPSFSDQFFTHLTAFTAGMISHITDLKALHDRKIRHTKRDTPGYFLPPNIKFPAVFMRLTDILGKGHSLASMKTTDWAIDLVQIMFKSFQTSPPRIVSESSGTQSTGKEVEQQLSTLVDARFKVANPDRFRLLKGNVERDVSFNPRLGVFALRIQAEVGTTILDTLTHRLRAIERLVDCIDAISQSNRDIRCEDITLNQITFTYSDQHRKDNADEPQQNVQRWKACLILREDRVKLELERGNPHLRVIDILHQFINSELRVHKLPFFLSSTLPIMRALDSIEETWTPLAMRNMGRVEIFPEHLDWYNIRYVLPGPGKGGERRLSLQLKLRPRRGGVVWHISRAHPPLATQPDDIFKKALSRVWNADGQAWQNLVSSAAVDTDNRIEALLKAVDEVIRPLAMQSPSMARQAPPKAQQAQQQRNQIPNQAMNQKIMAAAAAANKGRQQPHQAAPRQQAAQGQVVVLDD